MYKVAIGYNADFGYAAWISDCVDKREKTVKGNSIRQVLRNIHEAIAEDEQKKRRFPLERESASHRSIITQAAPDPFFDGA